MGRRKPVARRLAAFADAPAASPAPVPAPVRAPPRPPRRRKRPRAPDPHIAPPAYAHASAPPCGAFRGDVAVLHEVAVPADARVFDPACEPPAFARAYRRAVAAPSPPPHVLVADRDPGKDVAASGLRRPSPARMRRFLRHHDHVPVNSDLLTVAIVPRAAPARRFDLLMRADSLPVVVVKMVRLGLLRMYYVPERDAVQMVVRLRDPVPGKDAALFHFLRSALFRWLYNRAFAAAAVVQLRAHYDREFVYGAVRRRKGDADEAEYRPFLETVRHNRELDVSLRPYQERAVAWMLSRELGPPLDLRNPVEWEDARRLAGSCPLNDQQSVRVQAHVTLDVVHGTIERAEVRDEQEAPEGDGCRGGLLCDEMGLGKTVELMQLVLCNTFKPHALNGKVKGLPEVRDNDRCMECEGDVSERDQYSTCLECGGNLHEECTRMNFERVDSEGFVCKSCHSSMERLLRANTPLSQLPKSKATVVVIPTTLLLQWKREVEKHVREALTVEVYQGHKKGYMPLTRLMKADVVLVTYDALKDDVHTFNALRNPRRGLRHAKVHHPIPLPLLSVRWHRVAWDESQMLGATGVSQAAQLAKYLHATYRWCVSGTPMTHCIREAIPMFDILQVQDGRNFVDWSSYFTPSFLVEDEKRLRKALRAVMWRSSKDDVNDDELGLPPQVTEVVHTSFGPVERYHYSSLQEKVKTATAKLPVGADTRSRTISSDLLTMLRQACCHPQIGISGRKLMSRLARQALGPSGAKALTRYDAASQAMKRAESPLDMNEVLHALVTKAQAECAEALRSFVASANGLAATCWLQQSILPSSSAGVDGIVSAIQLYRETLGLVEENKNVVQMDTIQRMHILFNLNEALDSVESTRKKVSGLPISNAERQNALSQLSSLGRTLRDEDLLYEVNKLKQDYVAEAQAQLVAADASFKELASKLGREPLMVQEKDYETEDDFETAVPAGVYVKPNTTTMYWWDVAVSVVLEKEQKKRESFVDRVIRKLLDAIPGGGLNVRTLAHRLSSIHSFTVIIPPEIAKLQHARDKLHKALREMPGSVPPSQAQIAESGQCRECREFGIGPPCSHCRAEHLFEDVERRLYALRENDTSADFVLGGEEERVERTPCPDETEADAKAIVDGALRPKSRVNNFAQNAGGLRFQSELETILKSLSLVAKEAGDSKLDKRISQWFDGFQLMKKEHAEARAVFEAQRSYLARMDEVNMALMRLSVLGRDEDLSSLSVDQQRHRVPRESLSTLNVEFSSEKAVAEGDFRGKRGNLVFLQSLQKSSEGETTAGDEVVTRGACAVCLGEFDDSVTEVALFACGHILCCQCTLLMIKGADAKSRVSSIRCPTCRVKCSVAEINFTRSAGCKMRENSASTEGEQGESDGSSESGVEEDSVVVGKRKRGRRDVEGRRCKARKVRKVTERDSTFYDGSAAVVGLIGAKASGVVRTLRGIWQQDGCAKVIIFSEWSEVINVVSRALRMNKISHRNGAQTTRALEFARMISEFRVGKAAGVLLLPLKKAAAGLNLTEARHVVLMEASMDVSMESQAVGRVHRIGQEGETFVHRMVMKDTIEECVLRFGDAFRGASRCEAERSVRLEDVIGEICQGQGRGGGKDYEVVQ